MNTTTIMPVLAELVSTIEAEVSAPRITESWAEVKARALAKAAKALAQMSEEPQALPHIKPIEGKLAQLSKKEG